MDQIGIVKRAARLVWQFRGLWLIGAILALVSGSGGGFSGTNFGGGGGGRGGSGMPFPNMPNMPRVDQGSLIALVLCLVCLGLILAVVFSIVRYVLTAGIFQAVDELDSRGTPPSLRQAWRAGWNRRTWRLFLQDLVVGIPLAIVVIALILLALVPFFLLGTRNTGFQVGGVLLGVFMLLVVVAIIIVLAVVIDLLSQFWYREAILADRGAIASMESAVRLLRSHFKDIGVMWLVMFAIGIGWSIVAIPVFLIVFLIALAVGGVPAYALYAGTHSLVLAAMIGVPLFLVVFAIPVMIIGGYYTAFKSTAWTLAYRYVTGRVAPAQPPAPPQPPAPAPSGPVVA